MAETHLLLARVETAASGFQPAERRWVLVRGGRSTDWSAIQARHRRLEAARTAGRLVEIEPGRGSVAHAKFAARVLFLAIRAGGDPEASAARGEIALAALEPGRGTIDRTVPFRRWGERQGLHSHEGGWIYRGVSGHPGGPAAAGHPRPECALTRTQGWEALRVRAGKVVYMVDAAAPPNHRLRYFLTEGGD